MLSLLRAAAFAAATAPLLFAGDPIYTVSTDDDLLRTIDPFTGQTLTSVPVTVAGSTVQQLNGMARHPATGVTYVMVHISGQRVRSLGSIDLNTGVVTLIGSTGDRFSTIAFGPGGVLYGVTGDGANQAETLYTLDLNTGAATLVQALGNGDDGEAITFSPIDGLMYHASGLNTQIFETVDVSNGQITNVPLSGDAHFEPGALAHWVDDTFLFGDVGGDLFAITTSGVVSFLSSLDHTTKGIVIEPSTSSAFFRPYGEGCIGSGGAQPVLFGTGCPAPAQRVSLAIVAGMGGANGALAVGTGVGSVSLPGLCAPVQILPVLPFSIPFALGGTAAGDGSISIPLTIPSGTPAFDLFFQATMLDGSNIVLSNPLRTRVQ